MKQLLPFILALLVYNSSCAQQSAPRLIIRGDDMGFSHSGNLALIKTYKEGIEQSIEVIVPSPWFPEAAALLAANPGVDVGIHLAITSEWDNIKWRPVSNCPSLTNADGYFYPMIWPNKNYPDGALIEHPWKIADIEKEFRAQIELALKKFPASAMYLPIWAARI
ncbi:ChbG/HpnK family deacetylase [Paraflavitalea speifideaquila]|uniref:ChbG/HpnK family deacetylase n=1 Tax=Paraflavitalea speifideaquila TaxID=3076558 RepID=UPI0028E8083A|nr:ChbG/HpnK family deacetylase [Paraflavitalea speifideiaquila]